MAGEGGPGDLRGDILAALVIGCHEQVVLDLGEIVENDQI